MNVLEAMNKGRKISGINTLPNGGYLIAHSTMQCLCLNNNEREKTMNGYFILTADGNIIQSPVTFEPAEKALNGTTSVIESLPFLSLSKQRFLVDLPP